MDMQLQMRRNVDEMHASIGDLSAWTSEIGKRDRSLRPGTAGSQAATQAATDAARQEEEEDAREIAAAKEELRRLYGEEQSTDPAPRSEPVKGSIGQKYDKWNHFNAEGVIKQLEESEADKERLLGIAEASFSSCEQFNAAVRSMLRVCRSSSST